MQIDDARIKNTFLMAETRAFTVYERNKGHPESTRAGIYALGHFEGLKEALRLLESLGYSAPKVEVAKPPLPAENSPKPLPPFAAIFQKLRPKHGPKALGNW